MDKVIDFNWQEPLNDTYDNVTTQVLAFAPQLIEAAALLLVGWITAHALRIITKKLVRSFDTLFKHAAKTDVAHKEKMKRSYAVIISKTVFWTVIVFFIAATVNMLGWQMFSKWMHSVITHVPNVISGLLIILAGFLLAGAARAGVISATHTAKVENGEALARVVQIIILFTTLVIGIEQIGINVHFLTNLLVVAVGVLLAGGALAFSFGAKTLVSNIIGAQYVRKHCRVGELMQMGDVKGSIVDVTHTSIVLDTEQGRTIIPAHYFQERVSVFTSITVAPVLNKSAKSKPTAKKSPKKQVKAVKKATK